jgi:hypothetical protein
MVFPPGSRTFTLPDATLACKVSPATGGTVGSNSQASPMPAIAVELLGVRRSRAVVDGARNAR